MGALLLFSDWHFRLALNSPFRLCSPRTHVREGSAQVRVVQRQQCADFSCTPEPRTRSTTACFRAGARMPHRLSPRAGGLCVGLGCRRLAGNQNARVACMAPLKAGRGVAAFNRVRASCTSSTHRRPHAAAETGPRTGWCEPSPADMVCARVKSLDSGLSYPGPAKQTKARADAVRLPTPCACRGDQRARG